MSSTSKGKGARKGRKGSTTQYEDLTNQQQSSHSRPTERVGTASKNHARGKKTKTQNGFHRYHCPGGRGSTGNDHPRALEPKKQGRGYHRKRRNLEISTTKYSHDEGPNRRTGYAGRSYRANKKTWTNIRQAVHHPAIRTDHPRPLTSRDQTRKETTGYTGAL